MTAPLIRWGHVRLTPESEQKLQRLLQSPKTRAAASRKLNDESRVLAAMCTELAQGEMYRRPDERRTELSKSHPTHYVDSFEPVLARQSGVDKLRVGVRNTHPAHRFVEKGTQPHEITARNTPKLVFPYLGQPGGHGGPRFFAPWLVTGGGAPFSGPKVNHPGAVEHQIMRRTLREYRRRARRRLS